MTAAIQVDLRNAVPPYEQIRAQIAGHIATGTLGPGDRLPTVRDLASDLGIAIGTVQRAYRELESAGLVLSRRRHGTTVAPTGTGRPTAPSPTDPAPAVVRRAAHALVREARSAGLSDGDVLDLVRGALATSGADAAGGGEGTAARA